MNFDREQRAPCVIRLIFDPKPRCNDAEFALANPQICPSQPVLIIRPAIALFCQYDSIQFRVFKYFGGVETELTSGVTFESSNPDVFAIGVNSGSGTALSQGTSNITATYNDKTVTSAIEVTAGAGTECCDEFEIATALVVDNSRSMTLGFGGGYATRLTFAKFIATLFASNLIQLNGVPKDRIKVWSFDSTPTDVTEEFTGNESTLATAIASITQGQQKTDLLDLFTTITDDLLLEEADRRMLVIVSDGEHTNDNNRQAILDAAAAFKQAGGIVMAIGIRASGAGFDLLQRISTGGYFINATADSIETTQALVNYLKSTSCTGNCIPTGDSYANSPELDYSGFLNWQVIQGNVNLLGPGLLDLIPGNGLYVDLGAGAKALMRSIDSYPLVEGRNYRISFKLAGNQRESVAGQALKVYIREVGINDTDPNIFEQTLYPLWNQDFHSYGFVFPALHNATVRIYLEQLGDSANPVAGNLVDDIVFQDYSTLTILLHDDFDDENVTFLTPACGPSAAVTAIADPDPVTGDQFDFPDVDMWNGDTYRYAVSFLTREGETALSTVLVKDSTPYVADSGGIRLTLPTPPANVIAIRIWRNVETAGTDLWLLASVDPEQYTTYDDIEDHTTFSARADFSVTSPTSNTTGKEEGELGIGYSYCCYYWTEGVDNGELASVIPEMTSNTTPSGEVTTNTLDLPEISYYAFDNDPGTLWRGLQEVLSGVDSTYATDLWLAYEFPAAKTVRRYSVTQDYFGSPNGPKAWEFQGSNDGASWTTLDTQADVTDWGIGTEKFYNIGTPGSYKFYRINITAAQDLSQHEVSGQWFAWSYIGMLKMFVSTSNQVTHFENNCPLCADGPPGEQEQDPNPLADIESGYTPPVVYSSTKSVCAVCPTGQVNLSTTALTFSIISANNPTILPYTLDVRLDASAILRYYRLVGAYPSSEGPQASPSDFILYGSNDGANWTQIDEQSGLLWTPGQVRKFYLPDNLTSYNYYRFVVSAYSGTHSTSAHFLSAQTFYAAAPTQICETATETSTISQADADQKASASAYDAAWAQMNCVAIYTATESAVARCPIGSFGNEVNRSATRQSLISQADAVDLAQSSAQAAANDALDCTLSNNTQRITIYDSNGVASKADPYPSVKYVTGKVGLITKVTVAVYGIEHNSPDDIGILLRSPEGTLVHLMGNCGGIPPGSTGTANVNLTFDDAAGSFLPDSSPLVSGTFKPKVYVGSIQFPELPAPPYETTLASLIGETPNGAWSLWVIDDLTTYQGIIANGWDITITSA